jgi:hypothetical protein
MVWRMRIRTGGRVELLTDIDHYLGPDEQRIRAVLDLLIDRAPERRCLWRRCRWTIEDFVEAADEHRLQWIEQRAEESPRFRQALQHVWLWDMAPDVFARPVEDRAG